MNLYIEICASKIQNRFRNGNSKYSKNREKA